VVCPVEGTALFVGKDAVVSVAGNICFYWLYSMDQAFSIAAESVLEYILGSCLSDGGYTPLPVTSALVVQWCANIYQ
jgi:hypothetical protein